MRNRYLAIDYKCKKNELINKSQKNLHGKIVVYLFLDLLSCLFPSMHECNSPFGIACIIVFNELILLAFIYKLLSYGNSICWISISCSTHLIFFFHYCIFDFRKKFCQTIQVLRIFWYQSFTFFFRIWFWNVILDLGLNIWFFLTCRLNTIVIIILIISSKYK